MNIYFDNAIKILDSSHFQFGYWRSSGDQCFAECSANPGWETIKKMTAEEAILVAEGIRHGLKYAEGMLHKCEEDSYVKYDEDNHRIG
jgi:hypothetical protein